MEGEKGLKGLVTLISEQSDLPKSFQGSNRNYYIRHFCWLFPTPTFVLCKCCTVYYQHTMFTLHFVSLFKYLAECNPFYFENKFELRQRSIIYIHEYFCSLRWMVLIQAPWIF